MAKVFGGGSNCGGPSCIGGGSETPSTSSTSNSPKVFNSGITCGDRGAQNILPTSSDSIQAGSSQTFSTQPNVYSKSGSGVEGINLRDFYTKSEINKVLKTKANVSDVYDKAETDILLQGLENSFNSSILSFVTESELTSQLVSISQSITSDIQNNYYDKSATYTKYEVNQMISSVSVGTEDFIVKVPQSVSQNTVDPGSNPAVPLTLKGSTSLSVDTIQHWIDSESNSVARIRNTGQVEFYGSLEVGSNVPDWLPSISAGERRVVNVADPIDNLDAVNKKYVEDYITELINSIVLNETYLLDGLEY